MSLIKWNPESALLPTMPNWMDDFFTDRSEWMKRMFKGSSVPAVNISENEKNYKLEVAAPGFKKEDFKIEVKNGYLNISAEAKVETEKTEDDYKLREFQYNAFTRAFALPENTDMQKVEATYADGILLITVPKTTVLKEENITKIAVK
jgi:HSP20 family protein